MTNVKLSQITPAGINPVSGTQFVAVTGGTTDNLYTLAEVGASILAIGETVTSGTPGSVLYIGSLGVLAQDNAAFFWDDTAKALTFGTGPVTIVTDAAGILAQRNSTNAQSFKVYNTYTNSSNYERAIFDWQNTSNVFTIGTEKGSGGGTLRDLRVFSFGQIMAYGSNDSIFGQHSWFFGGSGVTSPTGIRGTVGIGQGALTSITSTGGFNTCIGYNAGNAIQDSTQNVAIGPQTLQSLVLDTSGNFNCALGPNSLQNLTTGFNNMGFGGATLQDLTNGNNNVAIGVGAGYFNFASGSSNVFIGFQAWRGASGDSNVVIGQNGLINVTSGSNNVCIGGWQGPAGTMSSVIALSDGAGNLLLDYNFTQSSVWSIQNSTNAQSLKVYNTFTNSTNYERAIFDWQTTSNVLSIGTEAAGTGTLRDVRYYSAGIPALYRIPNVSGDNWFVGGSGNTSVSGNQNFGMGPGSLASVTTGTTNAAYGYGALASATTGVNNVAFGTFALNSSDGGANTAVGARALIHMANGSNQNTAIGYNCMQQMGASISSYNNIGLGASAAQYVTSGSENIFIGVNCAAANISGSDNIIMGQNTASNFSGTCNQNTIIGANWNGPNVAVSNAIILMDGSAGTGANITNGLDCNYTLPNVWSFQRGIHPLGLHVYNTTDSGAPPTNYERAVFDWQTTSNVLTIGTEAAGTGSSRAMQFSALDYVFGTAALATNATDGFLYIPTCAGTPTGTPTSYTGVVPLIFDTTNSQLWIYTGGAWKQPKTVGTVVTVDWQ